MSRGGASTPVVVAMLKAPRAGFVKTRLAQDVGPAAAATVYRRLVERQMIAIPHGWRVEVHFAPADAALEMQSWLGTQRTSSDWLLFLHADTLLPLEAESVFNAFAAKPAAQIGTFRVRFANGGLLLNALTWAQTGSIVC